MTITPPENTLPIFLSAFTEALHGRSIGVSQAKIDEFLIGYSILYRRFQRSLRRFLKTLEEYETERQQEGWNNSTKKDTTTPIDDFLEAIYNAAELYAFYESGIVKLLNPSGKVRKLYRTNIAALKREVVLICNRCKHNYAFMQSVEILYESGLHVAGFAVYQMRGQCAKVNTEIHNLRQAFSFNWGVRRLIGNLMLAEQEAANLVKTLEEKPGEKLASLSFTLPLFKELEAIIARPEVAMPLEVRSPNFHKSHYSEVTVDARPQLTPRFGKGKMRVYLDIIGQSVALETPYVTGEGKAKIGPKGKPGHPVPIYIRMVASDIEVEDK